MAVDYATLEKTNGLPAGLLNAVAQAESNGNPDAENDDTATGQPSIGKFQFQPATAKAYGVDPTDPDSSAIGAAKMFGDLNKQYNGDLPSMLAAYNWGSGNLAKNGLDNAPQETRDYIAKITKSLPKQTADSGQIATDAAVDSTPAPAADDSGDAKTKLLLLARARLRLQQSKSAQQEGATEAPNSTPPTDEPPSATPASKQPGMVDNFIKGLVQKVAPLIIGAPDRTQLALRSTAAIPLGVVQKGLEATGAAPDVQQSIANVNSDTDALRAKLDKLNPDGTGWLMNKAADIVPQAMQTLPLGGIFTAAPEGAGALGSVANWAGNVGKGAALAGGTAYVQPRSEATPEAREVQREGDAKAAAIMGGALTGATSPLIALAGKVADRFNPTLLASNRLNDIVGDTDAMKANIDKAADSFANNPEVTIPAGYQPTTAQIAGSPGMASLERGARLPSSGDVARQLAERDISNRGAISDSLTSLNPEDPDSVFALRQQLANLKNSAQGNIQGNLNSDQSAADLAQQLRQTTSNQQTANLPQNDRADISAGIYDKVKNLFQNDRATKNALFQAIDPNGTVQVPTDKLKNSLISQLDSISSPTAKAAATPALADEIYRLPDAMSFKQLQEYRPLLSDEIAKARMAGNGQLASTLQGVKSTLESYTDDLANGEFEGKYNLTNLNNSMSAGQNAKNAIDFYKNTYSPRWNTGPGQQIARGISTYNEVAPETVGSKLLRPGDVGASTFRNLNAMMEGDPSIKGLVQDHMLADMQQTPGIIDDNGIINPNKLSSWMDKNAQTLKQLPAIKSQLDDMQVAASSADQNASEMAKQLKDRQTIFANQQKALNNSAISKVLGQENTSDAIGSLLNSDNPTKNIRSVVNAAQTDPTGKAMKGLQQATYDHLNDVLTNTQTRVGENAPQSVSLAKLDNYLGTPQKVNALRQIIGDDGVNNLNAAREGLKMMSTMSNYQLIPGSATSENSAAGNIGKRMLTKAFDIVTGGNSNMIQNGVLNFDAATKGAAGRLLNKAILDPQYAKMLADYQPFNPKTEALRKALFSGIAQTTLGQEEGKSK